MKRKPYVVDPDTYIFTFGKWKGEKYHSVPESYIHWCVENIKEFVLSFNEKERILNIALKQERAKKNEMENANYVDSWGWHD